MLVYGARLETDHPFSINRRDRRKVFAEKRDGLGKATRAVLAMVCVNKLQGVALREGSEGGWGSISQGKG